MTSTHAEGMSRRGRKDQRDGPCPLMVGSLSLRLEKGHIERVVMMHGIPTDADDHRERSSSHMRPQSADEHFSPSYS